jgi:hypothetical protein
LELEKVVHVPGLRGSEDKPRGASGKKRRVRLLIKGHQIVIDPFDGHIPQGPHDGFQEFCVVQETLEGIDGHGAEEVAHKMGNGDMGLAVKDRKEGSLAVNQEGQQGLFRIFPIPHGIFRSIAL